MKTPVKSAQDWQNTQYSNLIRYVPSGTYFARFRVHGKLIRKSLQTDVLTVAKLRLADMEKVERGRASSQANIARGKMTFEEAASIYKQRIEGDVRLKKHSKEYYFNRLIALLKSWPDLAKTDIGKITKTDCLNWSTCFVKKSCATGYNNTVKVLRDVIAIGMESGSRYDNPASGIKRASVRPKKLQLPEFSKFGEFVAMIRNGGGRFSNGCANLVEFLAYSGCRKTEAANVRWKDCDFERGQITVLGDPESGLKGRQAGECRIIPMISDMRQLLERLNAGRTEENSSQSAMQVRECQKAIDRASKLLGIARITHHDLRHLFATRCIESGVDIPTVSRWLGHKDGGALAMRIYGHLRNEHSQQMAKKVSFSSGMQTVNATTTATVNQSAATKQEGPEENMAVY